MLYAVATDTLPHDKSPGQNLKQILLDLNDDKTRGQPGYFPCIPGMPVMLKENLATELGLCNSTIGELVSVVIDQRNAWKLNNNNEQCEVTSHKLSFLILSRLYILITFLCIYSSDLRESRWSLMT